MYVLAMGTSKPKIRVFLVRHGQSEGNVNKKVHSEMADHAIPLSDEGTRQAGIAGLWLKEYIGKNLKGEKFRLWTSPYTRTRQTTDSMMMMGGLNSIITPENCREEPLLCEQQFGLFDGIPEKDLPTIFPKEHAFYEKQMKFKGRFWAPMPLGESRFDVYRRCHQSFGTFQRDLVNHGINNIVVVSHGTTIRAFVTAWTHQKFEWFDKEKRPDNCAIRLIEDGKDEGYIYKGFV